MIASESSLTVIYIILLSERTYVALAISYSGLENLMVTLPFILIFDIVASSCLLAALGITTAFVPSGVVILIPAAFGFCWTSTYMVYWTFPGLIGLSSLKVTYKV